MTFRTGRRGRLAYPVLLLLGVVDAAGYSVIGPILPAVQRATGASVLTVSLLAGCFPLAMLGGFAVAGRLAHADRTGVALAGGLGCLIAGSVVFAVTVDLPALFAARTVMGVGSGGLWMAITLRTLEYRPGQEYLSMSRVYAAYSVGALVGPGLATLHGVPAPFVAYAILLAACLPLALALPAPASGRPLRRDPAMLRSRRFWVAATAIMFAVLAPGILDGVLPLHLATHLSQTQIGLAYTATAVLIALASALAGSARPARALVVGGAGIVTGVCLAGATAHVPTWLVALTLIGFGAGAAQTGATGILLDTVPTERIITAMVVWSQMGIAGYLVAPVVGGPLAAGLGFRWLGLLPLTVALLLAGVAMFARRMRRWPSMEIRTRQPADVPAVATFLDRHGSTRVVRLDRLERSLDHPALLAVDGTSIVGVLTYIISPPDAEVLTLHVERQWHGGGTALLRAVERVAVEAGCARLFLITTNDNVDALRFYQRRGFRLAELHPGAVERSRATHKPEIPATGEYGIPLRDELVLDKRLGDPESGT